MKQRINVAVEIQSRTVTRSRIEQFLKRISEG